MAAGLSLSIIPIVELEKMMGRMFGYTHNNKGGKGGDVNERI